MTYKFECDGCGKILPLEQLKGGHGEIDDPWIEELVNEVHTCHDCWNAFDQWRKDRYNNAGKGVNTGLSTVTINSPTAAGGTMTYLPGTWVTNSPITVPTLTGKTIGEGTKKKPTKRKRTRK